MIHGITFDQQLISSDDMAHFMWVFGGKKSGVTKGCTMTTTATNITIAAGRFIVYGRFTEVSGTETVAIPEVSSGTSYCRLVYEIDLSKTNTTTQFLQGTFKIVSANDTYPTLTQQDLDANPTTGVYQFPFAKFTVDVNGMANWVDERKQFTETAIVQIPSSGWSATAPYTITVNDNSVIGTAAPGYDLYIPTNTSVADANAMVDAFACVNKLETGQGTVTLTCYSEKPTAAFQIQIKETV